MITTETKKKKKNLKKYTNPNECRYTCISCIVSEAGKDNEEED
jgi:hypothetical protein